jgi:antitoxin (DNA-binding transcriptional repressor) of toxin-antitoxin stability system
MKRVTASEARRRWFRLLDEVARGQVVVVERLGRRIVIQRQPLTAATAAAPDYSNVLRVPRAEDADRWGWTWRETGPLRPKTARRTKSAS